MDQNYNGNGNGNGMVFGGDNSFFSFDPSTLDHQPSGETILNDTEDDYLSTFFDNPNMAQQIDAYDNMFNLGAKSLSQAQGSFSASPAFGHHLNNNIDTSSLDPSQPATYQPTHQMNSMTGPQQPSYSSHGHAGFLGDSPSQAQSQTQPQTASNMNNMNNADMNAASSLYGFTNKTPPQSLTHNFSSNTGGQWGNLWVPQSTLSAVDSSSGNYAGAPGRVPSFTAHAHTQSWGGNGDLAHVNQRQTGPDVGSPYTVQPNPFRGGQSTQLTPTQQSRQFPGVDFGSDPNFNNTHYQGPQYSKDKSGNLLNVPLADKARVPYGPHAMANQHAKPQNGQQWGRFGGSGYSRPLDEHELASGSQARKRHKGQDGRDTEAGWDSSMVKVEQTDDETSMPPPSASAIVSPPSNKRRRTSRGQSLQNSNSPTANQDDEGGEGSARKRGSKKRENLTEDQKRKNHISSEKKRREIIQQGYNDCNKLVPCLVNGKHGLSRSECLGEIGAFLEVLLIGNEKVMSMLAEGGVDESHPALQAAHADWAAATARIE